jgi:MFS family permease
MVETRSQQTGRSQFWRVFTVLSVTMALEGVIWQAVMFGSALSFEEHFGRNILLIGTATSLIYVVSGLASYGIGRWILDRYSLKSIYIASSVLQIGAMLSMAAGNGWLALAGAIGSAVLGSATGPVENILIARYTPSRYHGLGFGAKFVVAFGAAPIAIMAIKWVREATGSLDLFFLSLAGIAAVIAVVSLLLPGNDRAKEEGAPAPAAAPAE